MPEVQVHSVSNITPAVSYPITPNSSAASKFSDTWNQRLKVPSDLNTIFEEAAKKYQVPSVLLKAVAKAESDFNADAVSRSGAQGIMQLMPATAKSLGVTNAFDARQNIMGGAKYLSDMLKKYDGNTKLALAAYNAGANNVDKYQGIPPFKETKNYVVKVMKYAQTDEVISVPTHTASESENIRSDNYSDILSSILNFDDFTSDDYLLLIELLKNNLQTSGMSQLSLRPEESYMNSLMNNRFKIMY